MVVKNAKMMATITMTESATYQQTTEQIDAEMQLVRAAQDNPRCFEPLYTSYYKRIVAFVYHRVESKEEAFEITAQVFYKALDNLPKYKAQGVPFSAWLFRIASNELNQVFRKNKSLRIISLDSENAGDLIFSIDEVKSEFQDEQLFSALQQLEEEEMEFINMRFFEKRSFKEIADITGTGESACKMRIYRILEKLKTKLKKY
jgi:RNA polymerase sigma-70 factor, ECF subfamily